MIEPPPVEAQRQIERRLDRIEAFAEIGAVLFGNMMHARRQPGPCILGQAVEIADHRLGLEPQRQSPVATAVRRHQHRRDCQCLRNIARRSSPAAQKRHTRLKLQNPVRHWG